MTPVAVDIRNVALSFGATQVLRDISLAVAPGEFFALLGPSGSGKSTLLRLIAGFNRNQSGQEACVLANAVAEKTRRADRVDVVLAPPFTAIAAVAHEIEETRGSIDVDEGFGVGVAAQNMHHLASGAFTGEISAPMLSENV